MQSYASTNNNGSFQQMLEIRNASLAKFKSTLDTTKYTAATAQIIEQILKDTAVNDFCQFTKKLEMIKLGASEAEAAVNNLSIALDQLRDTLVNRGSIEIENERIAYLGKCDEIKERKWQYLNSCFPLPRFALLKPKLEVLAQNLAQLTLSELSVDLANSYQNEKQLNSYMLSTIDSFSTATQEIKIKLTQLQAKVNIVTKECRAALGEGAKRHEEEGKKCREEAQKQREEAQRLRAQGDRKIAEGLSGLKIGMEMVKDHIQLQKNLENTIKQTMAEDIVKIFSPSSNTAAQMPPSATIINMRLASSAPPAVYLEGERPAAIINIRPAAPSAPSSVYQDYSNQIEGSSTANIHAALAIPPANMRPQNGSVTTNPMQMRSSASPESTLTNADLLSRNNAEGQQQKPAQSQAPGTANDKRGYGAT